MSSNNNNTNDKNLFRIFVNDITPLNTHTIEPIHSKPKAQVKKTHYVAELKAPTHQLTHSESDEFFAFHINKKNRKHLRLGKMYFDATIDLHGYTIAQSERLLSQFINDCCHQKISHAIIIHGQGHNSDHGSVLKPAVLYWLSQQVVIDAYCPAQPRDGGKGASYIVIKTID